MAGLVELRDLTKRHLRRGLFGRAAPGAPAVDRVSLTIERGEVFGLVGESGCGKTTLARALLHLDPPTGGDVLYDGTSLPSLPRRKLRSLRRKMQIVFQDPNAALDPKMRIRRSMEEGLRNLHVSPAERARRVDELLEVVGIPADHASRWPHEFSGGQKQRIVIARALTMDPEFIVLDEPVSNLDVSIQAQIINLLQHLREKFRLTYLFISHDLHLVAYLADRIGVMYKGRLVESAPTDQLTARQLHPYTHRLFASSPGTALPGRASPENTVEIPAPGPGGCAYRGTCELAAAECGRAVPELRDIGDGRRVACFRVPVSVSPGADPAPAVEKNRGGKQ